MPRDEPADARKPLDAGGRRLDAVDPEGGRVRGAALRRVQRGGPEVEGGAEHIHIFGENNRVLIFEQGSVGVYVVYSGDVRAHDQACLACVPSTSGPSTPTSTSTR